MTYNRGVVRDLLDYEDGLTSTVLVGPSSVEKFTKDGVEGLCVNFDLIAPIPAVDLPSSRNPSSRFGSGCQPELGGQFTTKGKHTVYCPFRVAMNHLTTRSILSCSFAPSEIAAKRSGCSHQ